MKRILFVDDEPELLDSLRARLYRHRADWSMVFVDSGAKAIAELEQHHFDLIASDVRMPGMDGGQLLAVVMQRWPSVIRMVLSGYAQDMQVLKLTSLAHQYLSKPCAAEVLESAIERCFDAHALLRDPRIREAVGRIGKLPAGPRIFSRLQQAIAEPNSSVAVISDIVASDPAMATKVLQIANSAFFRLHRPLSSIHEAVNYLGIGTLRTLVLSAELLDQWHQPAHRADIEIDQLLDHALSTAVACRSLATGTVAADDAWLVGLIHDIGYWVLAQECPEQLNQAITLAKERNIPVHQAEKQLLGANHAEIGAYLLSLWGLPYAVIEAVALHHSPRRLANREYDLLAVLCTAHALMTSPHGHSTLADLQRDVDINADYLLRIHAPFDWTEAQRRVQSTESHLMTH